MEGGPKKGYVKMPFDKPEDVEGPPADYYDTRLHALEVGQIDEIVKQAVENIATDEHNNINCNPEEDGEKPE